MNKIFYPLLSLIGFLTVSCHEKKDPPKPITKFMLSDTMSKIITIDTVGTGYIHDELTLSGEISFNENNVHKIFPRNSGQVIQSNVSLGDKVRAGQVLAVVRSADVAGNYADLSSAKADIAIAKRQLDNTASLFKNGIASEKEYTEAKENYQKALAASNKIQSIISINGGTNSNSGGTYSILSPIDGYIVEKKINEGAFIRSDMGDYLFTISDLENVWVNANVYEADISKVKEGFDVQVTTLAYPDKVFKGTIDKISQVLDPQSKTLKARIKLNNKDRLLRPDMFAKIVVKNKENKTAVSLPTNALISLNGNNYVVVYNNNDDLEIKEISILKTDGSITYINGGVIPGQKIITHNQLLIFQQLLNE